MIGLGTVIGTGIGIASALGSTLGGIGSSVIQGEYNKAEAEKNRQFQERMSNTAIQRQIADAQKAGISPAMLFNHSTNGANSPTGSSASISKPDIDINGIINTIGNILNTDRKLDYLENTNNKNVNKLNNQTRSDKQNDYNNLYTNLDNIII